LLRSSELSFRSVAGSAGELVGLVDDVGGDLLELVTVLTGVVGAEQKFSARLELHAKVGLGAATVATVGCVQRSGVGGKCSGHIGLISSSASVSCTT
jgi:hypothetical protein